MQGRARIEVGDTVPGIPMSELKTIFSAFYRLDAPVPTSEGMELWLAILERASPRLIRSLWRLPVVGWVTCFGVTVPFAASVTVKVIPHIPHFRAW